MIYKSLAEISDRFDLFLFDAYGVFWEGSKFYDGSIETMRSLVSQGKTVIVISNSTQMHQNLMESYGRRGLTFGTDYHYLLSSGDLLRHHLLKGDIAFAANPHPRKYFVIGQPHTAAFADTLYERVETMQEADFIYCGVPFLYEEDVAKYPQYADLYWPVLNRESDGRKVWDTLTEAPFVEVVEQAVALGLPILNANPDFTAKEGHPLVPDSPSVFVVRNGTLAEMFRQRGAEVLEYGKPHANIYDYTFQMLHNKGIPVDKARTCMVGDTVRTDVKGGINAGIVPILCIKTGVTAEEISKGKTVEMLCKAENIDVKQVIQINSVGGME
ncbi:MAG: HAD hydrolase-like protein [Alphaproteobacteria bacterium]|nr:HAD hydrolase-like protein [Alphaproteobacteria bacterium]